VGKACLRPIKCGSRDTPSIKAAKPDFTGWQKTRRQNKATIFSMQILSFTGSTSLESLNRKLASPAAALLKNTIDWVAARLAP